MNYKYILFYITLARLQLKLEALFLILGYQEIDLHLQVTPLVFQELVPGKT